MKVWKLGMLTGALCSVAGVAMAECTPTGGTPFVGSTALQAANLTVGRDVPLGSVIYRQQIVPSVGVTQVTCTAGGPARNLGELAVTPLPLSSWSTGPYAGKVYESGVAGIGVALTYVYYGWVLPYRNPGAHPCDTGCVIDITNSREPHEIVFVKIGDTASGTISGANLPTMKLGYGVTEVGLSPTFQVNFSGSINIVSRTCETPDVPVDMGNHNISEFGGVNTGTAWKDFTIKLNNCPAFHGGFPVAGPILGSDGTVASAGTRVSNAIGYRLDPNQTPIDASQGLMKLDDSAPGEPASAGGIGLQIASSTSIPITLSTLQASGITPTTTDGAAYTIPLKARYVQTEATVTGGPANASAVFTINYL